MTTICAHFPNAIAIYAFGSQIQGTADQTSVQRAREAVLDMGQHLVRREKLGVPQSARDVFELLARGHWISAPLADALKRMVACRNIAVHDDQSLLLPILVKVITLHLGEFLDFTQAVLLHDAQAT